MIRKLVAVTSCIVVLAAAILLGIFFTKEKRETNIDPNNQNAPRFTVYSAESLPAGYSYNPSSRSELDNVVSFIIMGPEEQQFFVSQQKAPDRAVIEKFQYEQMTNGIPQQTSHGQIVVGKVMGNPTASYVKDDTWVLISTIGSASINDFTAIVGSLESD